MSSSTDYRNTEAVRSLKELPAAPQPPEDEDEEERVGKIAHKYLSDYAAKQNVDKTFGIYKNPLDKLYYIGNTPKIVYGLKHTLTFLGLTIKRFISSSYLM